MLEKDCEHSLNKNVELKIFEAFASKQLNNANA